MIGWVEFMEWRWRMEAMGGSHGVDLIWGLQSTAKTMVEAWVALFGWIHGVDLKSEPKRAPAALLDPLPWL